ncbi:uncharacterized protein LOC143289622 [Babylonia areolata]|uniref:uncharacterized protein LOC143289622 n=1 Tax=Babylonia areolata TaxID=304850 RepID=UPI003FD0A6AA
MVASNAWATAAKSESVAKIQNASLRLITGGMKTTPIKAIAGTAGFMSLKERRDERLLRQSEKMKRLPSHPLSSQFQAPTKNWLKRRSTNHLVTALHQTYGQSLLDRNQPVEPLQDFKSKGQFLDAELKLLTLEALDRDYPSTTWTSVYTDGSAENADGNGGDGAYIRFPDGISARHSIATGLTSTKFRAKTALLAAAELLNQRDGFPDHTVFLTDCRAVLQSLQTRVGEKT